MKSLIGFTCLVLAVTGISTAHAACPASPPVSIKSQVGDQKVNAAWLGKNLGSRNVVFEYGGKETYKSDGSFSYSGSNGKYFSAPSFRFYDDGTRCINYSNGARFDRYVVRDKKLVLIDAGGNRYEGMITK